MYEIGNTPPTPPKLDREELFQREVKNKYRVVQGVQAFLVYAGPTSHKLCSEGWKIHIGANPQNALNITLNVLPVLQNLKVNHKILSSLHYINTHDFGAKFITIYPSSIEEAWNVIEGLREKAKYLVGPTAKAELPIPQAGSCTMRYGSYVGRKIWNQGEKKGKYGNLKVKKFPLIEDNREQIKPAWIKPFPITARPQVNHPSLKETFPTYHKEFKI